MVQRPATWLLAALLTLSAAAAVPSTRVTQGLAEYSIVWIASERAESEQVRFRPRFSPVPATVSFHRERPLAARLFARALYQRPPPRK